MQILLKTHFLFCSPLIPCVLLLTALAALNPLNAQEAEELEAEELESSDPAVEKTRDVSVPLGPAMDVDKKPSAVDSMSTKSNSTSIPAAAPVQGIKDADSPIDIMEKSDEQQVVKKDFSITIDTVQSVNVGKSLMLALGMSALVPGTGEFYLKDKKASRNFILTEVGFWGALWIAMLARDSYLQSSRHYGSAFAGLENDKPSEELLNAMTQYRSYREVHHCKCSYEQIQILSGKRDGDYDIPDKQENHWDFGSAAIPENTENWKTFIATTKNSGRAKIAITWAIGGLILGRVASTLNTLHLHRTTSVKGLSRTKDRRDKMQTASRRVGSNNIRSNPLQKIKLWVQPEIMPDYTGARMVLMF